MLSIEEAKPVVSVGVYPNREAERLERKVIIPKAQNLQCSVYDNGEYSLYTIKYLLGP